LTEEDLLRLLDIDSEDIVEIDSQKHLSKEIKSIKKQRKREKKEEKERMKREKDIVDIVPENKNVSILSVRPNIKPKNLEVNYPVFKPDLSEKDIVERNIIEFEKKYWKKQKDIASL